MDITFGVHTGPANSTAEELRSLWTRIEELPFDWISVWDHFYAADGTSTRCFEGVSAHMALGMHTSRVRCGSLVYCAGYRHPAVLANAMAAIDHFSGGRCEVGLGAGWDQQEYDAHGIEFPSAGDRLDLLDEYAAVVKALLAGGSVDFDGRFFQLEGAICNPAPVRQPMPLWIGGGGEKRTLAIVARYADGWNVPFIGPDTYQHKNEVLDQHCEAVSRNPGEVIRSVNLGVATDEESLARQYGVIAEFVRPGVLMGSTQQMVESIGRYAQAGAQQVNVALRAPFETAALEAIAVAIAELD